MSFELRVSHCPGCGNVFQKNIRNLCNNCSTAEDSQLQSIERALIRNRQMINEELSEATDVPEEKIRSWIRSGKIKIFDYPNLADRCDLCSGPIRKGNLCLSCTTRIQNDITHSLEQERLMKERLRAASSYISKN